MNTLLCGLAHIGIPTADVNVSRKFYESIGFGLSEDLKQPNGRPVIFMESHELVLEIYEADIAGHPGAIDHVAIQVTDIQKTYDQTQKLNYETVEDGIQLLDFGTRKVKYFTIYGPYKEKIEFCQAV